jgi:hypothetical protein
VTAIRIDFQDGFDDDTVVVTSGAREIARLEHVTTNLAITRADAVSAEVEEGTIPLRIEVPSRNASAALDVDGDSTPFVVVKLVDGRLDAHATSEEPFYL